MHMPIRFRSRGLICTSLFALLLAASAPITAEDALPIANHMIHHVDRPFTKLEMVEKSTRILELKGHSILGNCESLPEHRVSPT